MTVTARLPCRQCGKSPSSQRLAVRWPFVLGLYLLALLLFFGLTGSLLGLFAEGMQRSALPWWKLGLPSGVLLLAIFATLFRGQRIRCVACDGSHGTWLLKPVLPTASAADIQIPTNEGTGGATRRKVLRGLGVTATAGAGASLAALAGNRDWVPVFGNIILTPVETTAANPAAEWSGAHIQSYRRLGRTNAMVSDISLGSNRIDDVAVARAALDSGINYFDTSPDYANTVSERVLGEAMRGRRDKVFVATKFCAADGHLAENTPVPQIMQAVEASLRRLQTDYVDLIHVHSCNRVERLFAPNLHEAFDRLKEQGKVRFLGVSSHAPELEAVAHAAIDSGRFDVMMFAYHFGIWPHFEQILQKAAAHDVGIVAMKTLKGAKHQNLATFRDAAGAYSQSAFRWVLSNPNVSCLVVSIATRAQVAEYVYASGSSLRPTDVALLERYDRAIAGDYCQPHCGACLSSCVYELPINDMLRYRMYAADYGWESEGRRLYAKLQQDARVCIDCAAPCANTCPIGVPIQAKLLDAHRVLFNA